MLNYLRFIVIIIWAAKVVKNHELCKSLLHFIQTLLYKDKNRSIGVEKNNSVGKASPPTTSECSG